MANPFASLMVDQDQSLQDQEDFRTVRWYLERMLPWPGQNDDGQITIAWLSSRGAWLQKQARTPTDAESIVVEVTRDRGTRGVFASQGRMVGNRSAENGRAYKAVWLDIDFKHAQHFERGYTATRVANLKSFLDAVGLPEPSVTIGSGGGLHCYFAFPEAVSKEQWSKSAHLLRASVETSGFGADVACTTDAARVLRIAGTINRKPSYASPRKVGVLSPVSAEFATYTPDDLERTLDRFLASQPIQSSKVIPLQPRTSLEGNNDLASGVEPNTWFDALSDESKTAVLDLALATISNQTKFLECEKDGGDNATYHKLMLACARSGVAAAEDLWVDYASKAKTPDGEDELRRAFGYCLSAKASTDGISVGTILYLAQRHGADFQQWKRAASAVIQVDPPEARHPLMGGVYSPDDLLRRMNSHYFLADLGGAFSIARIMDDGSVAYISQQVFGLGVSGLFARLRDRSGNTKQVKAEKFWLEHPSKHIRKIVFKPGGSTNPNEFNLWAGFGVTPQPGWDKQVRLLRHLWRVICRRDKSKFLYLMRWLAWSVQNPDKRAETVIVLKSRTQGTGKSTLGYAVRDLFGKHSRVIADKDRLLGRFNAHLETACFVLAEEIAWGGDRRTGDALKSLVTGDTLTLEVKNGACWDVPNRLHIMMTSNHEHVVAAGVRDRRYCVLEVSDAYVGKKSWFGPLYKDLDCGGREQFLWLLKNLRLGDWHPSEMPRTEETIEQQELSADSLSQWSQACIEADGIVGDPYGALHKLGEVHATEKLRRSYDGFCKQRRLYPLGERPFGKALKAMFGPASHTRLPAKSQGEPRPWGYHVPAAEKWRMSLNKRLGIDETR